MVKEQISEKRRQMFNFKREIISKPILAGSQRLQRWRGDYQPPQNRIRDENNDNEKHRPWARELRIDMPRAPKTKHRGNRHLSIQQKGS